MPAARGRDAGQRAGPAAALQFEGHPAAERVADDVRGVPTQSIHPAFHVVGQLGGVQEEAAFDAAVVAGHGGRENLVAAGVSNQWSNAFPHVLGHHERMQQKHRLAGTQVNRSALGHAARD